jgi:hypothetical protein
MKFEKVKQEEPTASEDAVLMSWAVAQVKGNPQSIIDAVSLEDVVVIVMNGDKFAHDGGRTVYLNERRTVHGFILHYNSVAETNAIWSVCRQMGDGSTEAIVTEDEDERPLMVHMHDECICRHKDVGKYG